MRIRSIVLIGLAFALTAACGSAGDGEVAERGQEPTATSEPPATSPAATRPSAGLPATGTVLETMDGGGYTYVRVESAGTSHWAAGPQVSVSVGDNVTFSGGMAMRDFHSETLDRDFPVVYFVNAIVVGDGAAAAASMPPGHPATGAAPEVPPPGHGDTGAAGTIPVAGIERLADGQSVEEIIRDAATWSGKTIAVRGKVVKFNAGIMGKNWVHLRDGTGGAGTNDLLATTDATVAVGDIIVVRGVVATDRDFGSGYRYAVMVEDATIEKE